ncbi:MAG: NUDIX hydrolase [Proteobacteria bacterium]|nr:NUDIX hydrolase [Pseudomonadota bacterium]
MDNAVPALPSATVVLLREGGQHPELLMVKRRAGDAFGDSYAFPGGVVDHDESDAHGRIDGLTADEANAVLDVSRDGLDYYSAAIRELFEETGILLARDDKGEWVSDSPQLQALRLEVDKGRLPWSKFLETEGLRLACDALHYFAHWETPLEQPKRWSTRFFLAESPTTQDATHDGSEVTDLCWLTASQALAGSRDGSMKLPFPTIRNLLDVAKFATIDALIEWADSRRQEGIIKLRPIKIQQNGKSKFVVYGDDGYPADRPL